VYTTTITFNKKTYKIGIRTNGQGYDLEIKTKSRLSGNEYQKLKKYLEDEGYVDAARSWFGNNSIC
jgi:hypothetical protein